MLTVADSHDGATEHRKDYDETESSAVMLQRLRFLKKKKKKERKKKALVKQIARQLFTTTTRLCVCVCQYSNQTQQYADFLWNDKRSTFAEI